MDKSYNTDDQIFAEIDFHEYNETSTANHEPCLDCLLSFDAECTSCFAKSIESVTPPEHEIQDVDYTTYLSESDKVSPTASDVPSGSSSVAAAVSTGGNRFSKEQKSVLRVWYNANKHDPYPSNKQKDLLATQTGLTRSQVSLWLANTRRRQRAQQKTNKQPSPSTQQDFKDMTPYDRWKTLDIEYDALFTPMSNIRQNALSNHLPVLNEMPPPPLPYAPSQFDAERSTMTFDDLYAQSMASYETGLTMGTTISDNTLWSTPFETPLYSSGAPSIISSATTSTRPQRHRRRKLQNTKPTLTTSTKQTTSSIKKKIYQCTFCDSATFATKYDWARHEKSQHLNLETWTCCLDGPITPNNTCAFCSDPTPTAEHLEIHHYSSCAEKPLAERTFYRKDHLQQHMKLVHEVGLTKDMGAWRVEADIESTCGFCGVVYQRWVDRVECVARHFREGMDMTCWQRDRGAEVGVVEGWDMDLGMSSDDLMNIERGFSIC